MALAGLGALATARGALANSAARREKIQAEIARREAQKKAVSVEADGGGLVAAAGLFGSAVVSLGLIVTNPFSGASTDFQLPGLPSLPTISQSAPTVPKVAAAPKPLSESDLARAKIRAAQAARLEEKVRVRNCNPHNVAHK